MKVLFWLLNAVLVGAAVMSLCLAGTQEGSNRVGLVLTGLAFTIAAVMFIRHTLNKP